MAQIYQFERRGPGEVDVEEISKECLWCGGGQESEGACRWARS